MRAAAFVLALFVALADGCDRSSSVVGPALPLCGFEGNLGSTVALVSTETADNLRLEWSATAAANGTPYVPATRIGGASVDGFSSCPAAAAAFAGAMPKVTTAGERALSITLPKGWAAACAGRTVTLRLALQGEAFTAPCQHLAGDGLPFHFVEGSFVLDEHGAKVTSSTFRAGRYFEK